MHLGKCGRVLALTVGGTDGARTEVQPRLQAVGQTALADPAVAAKQRNFAAQHVAKRIEPLARLGRDPQGAVSGLAVGRFTVHEFRLARLVERIDLIERNHGRNLVGLRRCQKAVHEPVEGDRLGDRGDQYGLIDVGCDNLGLA